MPLIDSVVPEKASGQVADVYSDIAKVFGRVPKEKLRLLDKVVQYVLQIDIQ